MEDWPVVVTNRCADACAQEFGLTHREHAREWLYDVIAERGRVTDRLPKPVARLRSRSGYFAVADGVVVLPLVADRDGSARWIATDCKVFPDYRRRHGAAADVDPFTLSGADLVRHVNFTSHAVERFQERCGAHPDTAVARQELWLVLARDARAVTVPPTWCTTRRADFYLVSADEYVLPMSRNGSAGFAFDALTCIHRASDLFSLHGSALAARCRFDDDALPPGSLLRGRLEAALAAGGDLSWDRPPWARHHPKARFWILTSSGGAAPVAWQAGHTRRPLVLLGLVERVTLLTRIQRWFDAMFGRRGAV